VARYAQNSINDWRTHKGWFDLDYLAPGGLIVKIKNEYMNAHDPSGSKNEYGLGHKTKRWMDGVNGTAGFKFSNRFRFLTYYNFYIQRYADRSDFTQNFTTSEVGAGCETRVSDKTWMFLRYHDGGQRYSTHRAGITGSNDAGYDWRRVSTGLTWDSEARFEGELNAGYQWNRFNNSTDPGGNPYRDKSGLVAATSVSYKQTPNRTFTFLCRRDLQILGSGSSGYFMSTSFGLKMQQKIRTRFLLMAGCGFAEHKYSGGGTDQAGRKYKELLFNTSLKYALSHWFVAGIGYEYLRDKSNDSASSYRVNRIMASLEINPPLLHH
jgi:hypothetical protein